jgi:DNA processing protein
MDAAECAAWLRLLLAPGIGPGTARALLAQFGLPQQIFAAGPQALRTVVPDEVVRALRQSPGRDVEQAVIDTEQWLAGGAGRSLLSLADADYPAALLQSSDPPCLLYAWGRRELLAQPAIAIVGSRSCTQQGRETAEAFAHAFAHAGLTIVSGLALGIDAAAHRGALQAAGEGAAARTIAVVGCGIDIVYPSSHRALTDAVRTCGLVLSEFTPGTAALAQNFPRRNRVIAGLARGVLVVEAALRSGSLITARLAAELGRDVFAIPGSIHSPTARGCHRLIKEGAKLVESAQDVLDELRVPAGAGKQANPSTSVDVATELSAVQRAVLHAMEHGPIGLDTLAARCSSETGMLTATLLELELAQHVERLPGNRYQRLR